MLRNHVKTLKQLNSSTKIVNEYGPTEATVGCSVFEINDENERITIGKPIANTQLYITDKNNTILPIGVPGELCIAGDGLARGYLNNDKLTKERFVTNPFNLELGLRMYRTGDLARYLPDGNIEYLGRLDSQIKIRGYRIELGEIEAVLNNEKNIGNCVVLAKEDKSGNKRLVAYIITLDKESDIEDIKANLSRILPNYMVPTLFVKLDEMPLTPNGKVDRDKLPEPEGNIETKHEYVAPLTEVEKKLVAIWQEVLGIEKIGVHDNFFELGGHSLLVLSVISKINIKLGLKITVSDIFQFQTIKLLADNLIVNQKFNWNPLVPIQPNGNYMPIYLMPGQAMDVLNFEPMSKYLGSNQPMYGMQYSGLDADTIAMTSIEVIAQQNIKALKKSQPEGPYMLCGHSFGGFVAYEMAKKLVENGEQITNLFLLDTPSPDYFNTKQDEVEVALYAIYRIEMHYNIKTNISREDVLHMSNREVYNAIESEVKKQKNKEELLIDFDVFDRRAKTNKVQQIMNYNPPKEAIDIPITLFRAEENKIEDLLLGWDVYSIHEVKLEMVPGHHHYLLKEPAIQLIAKKIESECEKQLELTNTIIQD